MKEFWCRDCANCGKQVMVQGIPEEKCYWCGRSPHRKEVILKDNHSEPKKASRYEKHRFIEEHKKEIQDDIGKLPQGEVLKKWDICTTTYYKLGKGIAKVKTKARKKTRAKAPSKIGTQVEKLTVHERYLVLLGYQMAVREFLKAGRHFFKAKAK